MIKIFFRICERKMSIDKIKYQRKHLINFLVLLLNI